MEKFNPKKTAVLVIDMQNGWCHPSGGLARGGADTTAQQQCVIHVKELIKSSRRMGCHILWSIQEHLPDDITRSQKKIPSHLDKRGIYPGLRNTWDAQLVEALQEEFSDDDFIIKKHRMSLFYSTTLDVTLRMLGINHLVISGVSTNVCVESTIRDAYFRDYDITVVEECVAGTFPDLHQATLKNVQIYFGQVISLKELDQIF